MVMSQLTACMHAVDSPSRQITKLQSPKGTHLDVHVHDAACVHELERQGHVPRHPQQRLLAAVKPAGPAALPGRRLPLLLLLPVAGEDGALEGPARAELRLDVEVSLLHPRA